MKPKNKREAQVLGMANAMPALTAKHMEYVKARFDKFLYYRMNGQCKCQVCGHEWKEMPSIPRYWRESLANAMGLAEDQCPECGATLRPKYQRGKWNSCEGLTLQVMTTHEGWQVLRYTMVERTIREGEPTEYTMNEEYQTWLDDKGREVIATRPYTRSAFYLNMRYDEPFTVGHHNSSYNGAYYYNDMFDHTASCTYPHVKVSDTLARNGWRASFARMKSSPRYEIARRLLVDNRLETLAKTGTPADTLFHYAYNYQRLDIFWPQLRIAVRNGYIIRHPQMWEDMIRALQALGRDIHSPRYILPQDLKAEHDRWTRKMQEKERKEELRRQAERDRKYYDTHKQFQELQEVQGQLLIHPLVTASELVREGEAMHHCVGTYGDKITSLILSVCNTAGHRLETVEVDLKLYRIVQSRAVNNGTTKRHDEILETVTRIMPEIMRCNQAV